MKRTESYQTRKKVRAAQLQHHGSKLMIKGEDKKGQQISSHLVQYQDFKMNRAQSDTK